MDIERGNIKILFQKIPYIYLIKKKDCFHKCCTYNAVSENLYMRYAADVFPNVSDDERRNNYRYMRTQMQEHLNGKKNTEGTVFQLVFYLADKMLCIDGNEIKCKFDQLLRWREISLYVGQDFFTCAYLAAKDVGTGYITRKFCWRPIIRSDNSRIHNILKKGVAENHFHLNGSAKIFELNWLCLMNHITGRSGDFKKIKRSMQMRHNDIITGWEERESFYIECQRAALYRIYLFLCMKNNEYMIKSAERLIDMISGEHKTGKETEIEVNMIAREIQNLITITQNIYGAEINDCILDYAFEKSMMQYNDNICRLLAGERKFLYDCYCSVLTDRFDSEQKNIFYAYLMIRTDFRGEIIQNNDKVGFSNFSDYQNRKEYFIEGHRAYEEELVRLALNETLEQENMRFLEARICPKNTSEELSRKLGFYRKIVEQSKKEGIYDKLIYVLHFPKLTDKPFLDGVPRNNNVRKMAAKQAKSIVSLLEKKGDINRHIRGIDACSSEIACRPEAFGQVFRYLADIRVVCEKEYEPDSNVSGMTQNLCMTYHAGEDFFDIPDGLRAIDEAMLFCNLDRGSRLGHALALGIDPEKYYCFKGYRIVLSRQVLLDDIVWIYCTAKKLGCHIDEDVKTELIENYTRLYKEVYENNIQNERCPFIHEYYQSWKLRGDDPELYKLDREQFEIALEKTELIRFDRYRLNPLVGNEIRKNERCRKLYYFYHYNKKVRITGSEITEFKIQKGYIKLIREIQDKMIQKLACQGIGIETNPSSNYLIGTIKKYKDHPILRFNSRKLKPSDSSKDHLSVSINTDDQGVFDTLLENEYGLMTLALKKAVDEDMNPLYDIEDIYEWIDYVRNMGLDQVF